MSMQLIRSLFFGVVFFGFSSILSASTGDAMPDTAPVFLCGSGIFWTFLLIFFIFRFLMSSSEPEQNGFPRPKMTLDQKAFQDALEEFRREAQNQSARREFHAGSQPQPPRTSVPHADQDPSSLHSRKRTPSVPSRRQTYSSVPLYPAGHSAARSPFSVHPHAEEILAPVYELAGHGKLELLRKKLAKGANVNEQDAFFSETGLHRAAKRGDAAIVQLLLESGANVRFVTHPYGETPLHFAVSGRDPQVVRLLLQYGADPNAKDCFGRTPAQCSRFYGELRGLFEKTGAKI